MQDCRDLASEQARLERAFEGLMAEGYEIRTEDFDGAVAAVEHARDGESDTPE